jgi:hypothetical protein
LFGLLTDDEREKVGGTYGSGKEAVDNLMSLLSDRYVFLDLYLFDHGGITISTSQFQCSWDSGWVGFIYAEKGKEELSDERIEEVLRAEVKVFDNYITGEVYGFQVEDVSSLFDSCYGFYGEEGKKDAIEEAKSVVDYEINRIEEEEIVQFANLLGGALEDERIRV